jgi:hypothetical protein
VSKTRSEIVAGLMPSAGELAEATRQVQLEEHIRASVAEALFLHHLRQLAAVTTRAEWDAAEWAYFTAVRRL